MTEEFYMGQERRKHERITYHAPCRYEICSDEMPSQILESGTSYIKNISLGGLLIELVKSISVNTRLDLEVILPTTPRPIRAQAQVVWIKKKDEDENRYDVGMCFTEINPEDREKISTLKKRIREIEKL